MATQSERKALLFLAAIAALGVSVRGYRALHSDPALADTAALDRQIAAVDSASLAKGRGRAAAPRRAPSRGAHASRADTASVPAPTPSGASPNAGARVASRSNARVAAADTGPLPSKVEEHRLAVERSNAESRARVEELYAELIPRNAQGPGRGKSGLPGSAPPDSPTAIPRFPSPTVVDADVANADELAGVPWIGPMLAGRIVADRMRNGVFGSMAGLQRVAGIGPALANRIRPFLTFSRPLSAPPAVVKFRKVRRPPARP